MSDTPRPASAITLETQLDEANIRETSLRERINELEKWRDRLIAENNELVRKLRNRNDSLHTFRLFAYSCGHLFETDGTVATCYEYDDDPESWDYMASMWKRVTALLSTPPSKPVPPTGS